MSKKTSFAVREYTLGAGDEITIARTSDFLMCLEATDTFKVAFDGDSDWDDFLAGLTFKPLTGFNKVSIYNDTGASNTIKLGFGKGDVKDSRLTLSGSITNREEMPDATAESANLVQPSGTCATLVAANPLRKEGFFTNLGPGVAWLKSTTSTLPKGIPLSVGQSAVIETTAEINVFAQGGDVEVSRYWTKFTS